MNAEDCDYKVVSKRRRFPGRRHKYNTTLNNIPALGIDISHSSFVADVWLDDQRVLTACFANTAPGFKQLHRWLQSHGLGPLRTGIESTNTYGQALAQWLHERHFSVHLLNPEQTAAYARCLGQRNKTDPVDARLIAAYVAEKLNQSVYTLNVAHRHSACIAWLVLFGSFFHEGARFWAYPYRGHVDVFNICRAKIQPISRFRETANR